VLFAMHSRHCTCDVDTADAMREDICVKDISHNFNASFTCCSIHSASHNVIDELTNVVAGFIDASSKRGNIAKGST
jgi:hypothetical protein